ncbi:MAG: homocysteine S-methyltransferase family protein [Bacteroidota bacterium]
MDEIVLARTARAERLYLELESRILVLDGAMGTMIQRHSLQEGDFRNEALQDHATNLKGNSDVLSLTRPDIIKSIHEEYLAAGADIIETNTFSGTTIAQEDYSLTHMVDEINIESARLAREAADAFSEREPHKPRFVAGAMGPTNKTASLSPDVNDPGYRAVTFDELKSAYKQQAFGLMKGGADILLVETIFDTLNAKAALFAIEEVKEELGQDIPTMVSGTITDASGRTLSGQTTEAFLVSVSHIPLLSIGLNCALGAKELTPYLKTLSEKSRSFVSAHPNAGLPNEFGAYDQTAEEMVELINGFMEQQYLNIVGGCCGTTPDHIRAIATAAKQHTPRTITTY